MKVQIRPSCFETNSSSTHSLVMLNDEDYGKYKRGEIVLSRYGNFITKEEFNKLVEKRRKQIIDRYKELWAQKYSSSWLHKSYSSLEDAIANIDDDGTIYEYDENNMEIIHKTIDVNGVTVHGLSIYGYDY